MIILFFQKGYTKSPGMMRKLDVINRGFSGYNTAAARVVLPKFMPTPAQANVDLMV
jgi:hypothetical protein